MARVYLKKAEKTAKTDAGSTQDIVRGILSDIEEGREKVALEISAKFDKYSGNAILTRDEIDEAKQSHKSYVMICIMHMITSCVLLSLKRAQCQTWKWNFIQA